MEDQGKRLLLAVALAFVIMLVWQSVFTNDTSDKDPQEDQTSEQTTTGDGESADPGDARPDKIRPDGRDGKPPKQPEIVDPSGPSAEVAEPVADEPTEAPNPCEEEDEADPLVFDLATFRVEFSRCGGTVASWQLTGDKYLITNKDGKRVPMDMVPTGATPTLRPFSVRFLDVDWNEYAYWKAEKRSGTEIAFSWTYEVEGTNGTPVPVFELTKVYRLYPEDYLLELSVQIANKASKDERQAMAVSLFGYQDPNADTDGGWTSVDTAWRSSCFIGDEESRSSVGSLSDGPRKREARHLKWGGFAHSYFLVAIAPRNETDALYDCNSYGIPIDRREGIMRTDIVFPETKIQLGSWTEHRMVAYLGPKYLDKLDSISGIVGFSTGFDEAIDLGWFSFLARPMLWLMQWFYSFLGNWGLAIVFLTFLVKLATLYWTTKSMRSMKNMARLTPKVKELQTKYKEDKQRLQQETMNLYRSHNVNPLAGCLPILLQMPIWIALYRMLMYAAELYNAPLIHGWIDDLTSTDPYHILPVALLIVMFVQARLTPSTSDSMQQKIMQYGMPIMFGVFAFFFPAGLTLYIFTNTCLTALHHLWMRHTDPHKDDADDDKGKGTDKDAATSTTKKGPSRRKGKGSGKGSAKSAVSGRKSSKKNAGAPSRAGDDVSRDETPDSDGDGDDGDDDDESTVDRDESERSTADEASTDEPADSSAARSKGGSSQKKSKKKGGSKGRGGKGKRR